MFVRMLGWAYLALCVGYYFALKASLHDKRLMGPICVGMAMAGHVFTCCITVLLVAGLLGAVQFSLLLGVRLELQR